VLAARGRLSTSRPSSGRRPPPPLLSAQSRAASDVYVRFGRCRQELMRRIQSGLELAEEEPDEEQQQGGVGVADGKAVPSHSPTSSSEEEEEESEPLLPQEDEVSPPEMIPLRFVAVKGPAEDGGEEEGNGKTAREPSPCAAVAVAVTDAKADAISTDV